MTTITTEQIVAAIATTLDTSPALNEVQYGETLSESIQNLPLAQVYWDGDNVDDQSANDRASFKAGVRRTAMTINVDVYASPRAHIAQDIKAQMTLKDAVESVLIAQKVPPFFGLDAIKSFRWRAERTTFEYSDVKYAGVRFSLTVWVY